MRKSKWIRFLPFVPLILLLVGVNIFGDAGSQFHDIGDDAAVALLNGDAVYLSIYIDERDLKLGIVKNISDEVGCVALGASIVKCVHSSDVGIDDFMNLGVSGGKFYDVMGLLGAMKFFNKHARKLIICFDPLYFLNSIYNSRNARRVSRKLLPYAEYFIEFLLNPDETNDNPKPRLLLKFDTLPAMFSISYFQQSVKQLPLLAPVMKSHEAQSNSKWGIMDGRAPDTTHFMPDGSQIYDKATLAQTVEDVIKTAETYDIAATSFEYEHASEESKLVFEKLMRYCKAKGIKVKLFLCPLAPTLWDRYDHVKRPIFVELEEYAYKLAEKYSLSITGSYNPHKIGVPDEAFYDARHMRREKLSEYMDFTF